MIRYWEIPAKDEEREVHPVLRVIAESVLGLVCVDLGLKDRQLRWFRLALPGEDASFETPEAIHGRCADQLGANRTVWISADFDPRGDMLALARIVAHELRHSWQVLRFDRSADADEMQQREWDAYAFADNWVREHRAEIEGEIELVKTVERTTTVTKTLMELSTGELQKLLDNTDTAIEVAKTEAAATKAVMRAAQREHGLAEQAAGVLGGRLEMSRGSTVITGRERAIEERDQHTAAEIAELEFTRVNAEFGARKASVEHSHAASRLRDLIRKRENLVHGHGGRDWRVARERARERGVERSARPSAPAQPDGLRAY